MAPQGQKVPPVRFSAGEAFAVHFRMHNDAHQAACPATCTMPQRNWTSFTTPVLPSSVSGHAALSLSGAAQLPAASATAPAWACMCARVSGPHAGASEAARFSFFQACWASSAAHLPKRRVPDFEASLTAGAPLEAGSIQVAGPRLRRATAQPAAAQDERSLPGRRCSDRRAGAAGCLA